MTYYQQPPHGQYQQAYPGYGYPQEMKQSGFGVASLIIGIIAGIGLIVSIVVAAIGVSRNPAIRNGSGSSPFEDPNWMQNDPDGSLMMVALAGCSIFGMLLLAVLGAIFGLIGSLSSTRKKALAIIGLILNGLMLFGTIVMLIVGSLA